MVAIFSDVILVSNYHYNFSVKSHLEKLQIIENINKQCSKLSSHFLIEF